MNIWVVDHSDERAYALRLREGRCARQTFKKANHRRFWVCLPFLSLGARWHGGDECYAVVVGKRIGDIRLHEPDLRARAARQWQITVMREISNAIVRCFLGGQAGKLR